MKKTNWISFSCHSFRSFEWDECKVVFEIIEEMNEWVTVLGIDRTCDAARQVFLCVNTATESTAAYAL